MDNQSIAKIFQAYGIDDFKLLKVEKGYRNESHSIELTDGRKLNLILYKNEPEILSTIRNANRASNFLYDEGFPSRHSLVPKIINVRAGKWQKYGSLYNYLPGSTIPWEAYTKDHIKLLGKTMSDMHVALSTMSTNEYMDVSDICIKQLRLFNEYLSNVDTVNAVNKKLGLDVIKSKFKYLIKILKGCDRLADKQILHMDFVRSNILFDTENTNDEEYLMVSGVLDFEKAAYGHKLFDIARSLAFLLVDCKYKTEKQIRKYFLISGYSKRGSAKLSMINICGEKSNTPLIEYLIDIFLLYDFYKFLKHNPYESLGSNEHYIRTRNLLHSRGLIKLVDDTIDQIH